MRIGNWARLLLAAAPLLAFFLTGCGDFWQAPGGSSNTSFTLSNSGNIAMGLSTTGSSTITVTPANSFTGTVALSCAVTSSLSNPTNPSCSLSSTSVSISGTTAETSTLTVTTVSGTTLGAYTITVTGSSGSLSGSTPVCAEVSTAGTATCSTTSTTSGDFYILNGGTSGSISGYNVNSSSLKSVGSSVSLTGVTPIAMAIAPNGKFLMVSTGSGVFAYPITNGVVGSSGVSVTGDVANSIEIDTTSSWLLEAIPPLGTAIYPALSAVPINPSTGAYTQATIQSLSLQVANASLPNGRLAISGDDKNVFVALETGGTAVVPFNNGSASPLSSTATVIGVAHTSGSALSVAVDPGTSPRLFYIGETLGDSGGTAGGLRAFTYASLSTPSSLVPATGSPIASGGLGPTFILPEAAGNYVYVADNAGSIYGFGITGSSGSYTISTAGSVSAGSQPLGMAEDSTGSFIFEVGSAGSPYFDAYSFQASTGQLTSQVTSTSAATSIAIAAAPSQ